MNEAQLINLGWMLRKRRLEMGLSMRKLAAEAGVSPSYLGSLETAKNPATGRPAAPSLRILAPILEALNLDLSDIVQSAAYSTDSQAPDSQHSLLYVLGLPPADLLDQATQISSADVDHWFYVTDWRHPECDEGRAVGARVTHIRWRGGEDPYPDRNLRLERVIDKLEMELSEHAGAVSASDRVGLVIADCSAAMRTVDNPSSEIEYEKEWARRVPEVFQRALGRSPVANVCVYLHQDLEVLGLNIDLLSSLISLVRDHDVVTTLVDGQLSRGPAAAEQVLRSIQPGGISSTAWKQLSSAAAQVWSAG